MERLILRNRSRWRLILNLTGVLLTTALLSLDAGAEGGAPRSDGRYTNNTGAQNMKFAKALSQVLFSRRNDKSPSEALPLRHLDAASLARVRGPVLYRLGHSSILLKLGDDLILVDPVFSERASPVQWLGPRRFHPVPLAVDALPPIKAVLISHNHYDHLDEGSVRQLAAGAENFVVPLGVGAQLQEWGVAAESIVELDWWEELDLGELSFVATPAQHFSGRSLTDRNKTLWASWVIRGNDAKLFFSGDSGYFDGFKEIGERYGPFDVTMIENGAYNQAWRNVHMMPEESVQAHIDLRGRAMLPIHNSTFDLSTHAWYEPLERVAALASERDVHVLTPVIGAPVDVLSPQPTFAWWRASEQEMTADGREAQPSCEEVC
ncbi:MAG: MBL fold metallo-hydrolase [Pseudomonadota bacterium]